MRIILYLTIVLFFSFLEINAQIDSTEISLKNLPQKEVLEFYKEKISEIIVTNLNKTPSLKRRIFDNFINENRDSTNIKTTYWINSDGRVHNKLFGSSMKRNTQAHNELKTLISSTRLSLNDFSKIKNQQQGRQIFLALNFRRKNDSIVIYKKENDNIKFSVVQIPIMKGCKFSKKENLKNTEIQARLKNCMNKKIDKIVSKNFNISILNKLPLINGKIIKSITQFTINKKGEVDNIKSLGLLEEIENESIKAVKKIPKCIPAVHNNKQVGIIYTKPITIKID